jgi:butyryl-CoA dehydrogenase
VAAENLLGELGRGHIIAFNILNIGRFKLGAGCVGAARNSLSQAIAYAKQRKAFGKTIADFGLVQSKLAGTAVGVFAGESVVYRTVGMMDAALAAIEKNSEDAPRQIRHAIEEYAVECSIAKVWGSEMLDRVVDHTVQIFGGYGFVEEYPAERAYRDSRVNRIFEGTNEINRLIITGWLLKRAMSGQLALMPAIQRVMDEVLAGPSMAEIPEGPLAAEHLAVRNAKKVALFAAGAASQKYMHSLVDQQEIMGALADIIIEVFVMESSVLRAQKIAAASVESGAALPTVMAQVYVAEAMPRLELSAKKVIAAVAEGDMLRTQVAILRRLLKHDPLDTIALKRQIAARVIEAGKYAL